MSFCYFWIQFKGAYLQRREHDFSYNNETKNLPQTKVRGSPASTYTTLYVYVRRADRLHSFVLVFFLCFNFTNY